MVRLVAYKLLFHYLVADTVCKSYLTLRGFAVFIFFLVWVRLIVSLKDTKLCPIL